MVFRNAAAESLESLGGQIASVSTLDDPIRAAIFLHVAGAGDDVTRDQAAKALGISRRAAAFHLDKLAAAGLVEVSFRRMTGKSGPGAGRSSKLYRRSGRRFNVSIPTSNYEFLARLLAAVLKQTAGGEADRKMEALTRAFGVSIGAGARAEVSRPMSRNRLMAALIAELTRLGFEPFAGARETIRLRNCPYHDMAREDANFVCSMNLALMQGVVEGLELAEVSPVREPVDGMCCVVFHALRQPLAATPASA